jgi:hypothetical protein
MSKSSSNSWVSCINILPNFSDYRHVPLYLVLSFIIYIYIYTHTNTYKCTYNKNFQNIIVFLETNFSDIGIKLFFLAHIWLWFKTCVFFNNIISLKQWNSCIVLEWSKNFPCCQNILFMVCSKSNLNNVPKNRGVNLIKVYYKPLHN